MYSSPPILFAVHNDRASHEEKAEKSNLHFAFLGNFRRALLDKLLLDLSDRTATHLLCLQIESSTQRQFVWYNFRNWLLANWPIKKVFEKGIWNCPQKSLTRSRLTGRRISRGANLAARAAESRICFWKSIWKENWKRSTQQNAAKIA